VTPEAKSVFVNVDLREAGPQVRLPILPLRRVLQAAPQRPVSGGCNLLPVGEILELPLHWCDIGAVLLPNRGPHTINEHSIAFGDRCDDAVGDVILRRKNTRCPEIAIIGLGPELRSRLSIDKLSAHANAGTPLADASFQHVTRTEFGTQGTLASRLSLQPCCRSARDTREIPKPRKSSRNDLAEPVGKRLPLCITRTLERKHGDPQLFAAPGNCRIRLLLELPQLLRHLRIA